MIYFAAPILGWGRYENFEFGCNLAFSDPSLNSRSFVITALVSVFFIPICNNLHRILETWGRYGQALIQ